MHSALNHILICFTLLFTMTGCSQESQPENPISTHEGNKEDLNFNPAAKAREPQWRSNLDQVKSLEDWPVTRMMFGESNFSLVNDDSGRFSKIMRVTFPRGSWSPSNTRKAGFPVGGLGFLCNCGMAPRDRVFFRYYVRFKQGFDFVKGGKLPGLYGGTANTGGRTPDGKDGFSSRLMWRSKGDGEIYAYLPDTTAPWGNSIGRGKFRFETGKWYSLEQEVQLNTPGQNNGEVGLWVNGQLAIEQRGLRFRDVPQLKIEGIIFSTFFGGNDASWATPVTTYIDFADFVLSESYIGP